MAQLTFVEKINSGLYPSKEDFYKVYILDNKSFRECQDIFGLSDKVIKKLAAFYEIKKDPAMVEQRKKEYFVEKYGVDNPAKKEQFQHKGCQTAETLEKRKQTLMDKYGVDNVALLDSVKEKKRATCLAKYGVVSNLNLPEVKEKAQRNSKTPEVLQKIKETNLQRYGCEYPSQNKEIQDRAKETNLQKRGCEYPMQSEEVLRKSLDTMLQKYGVTRPLNDPVILERLRLDNLEHYGVPWTCMLDNIRAWHSVDSKPNVLFKDKLDAKGIVFNREINVGNYIFDFQVGNTVIEINPSVTHNTEWSPFGKDHVSRIDNKYHLNKMMAAQAQGLRCIHVWDWDNTDAVIELLVPREKIYARNCVIKEVAKEEAENFITRYHCQGYASDKIRVGLYYNETLVSIMTFKEPRYNKKYEYELIRYCSSYSVVGGAEKLFHYFINTYNCKSIVSYCDLSKFSGETYLKLGFSLLRKNAPSKHWYNPNTKQHLTDNLIRSAGVSRILHRCEPEKDQLAFTEDNHLLMLQDGFLPVYDCGQATFVYTR